MVIHDVVVNDHAVGVPVGRVLAAGPFDIVDFCPVGHVDELESITAANPNHVWTDVSGKAGDVVVATVEDAVVFGERCKPLVGGDVIAQHAQTFGADVSDVAHDLHHRVSCLGSFAPILVVLEVGFRDEADT